MASLEPNGSLVVHPTNTTHDSDQSALPGSSSNLGICSREERKSWTGCGQALLGVPPEDSGLSGEGGGMVEWGGWDVSGPLHMAAQRVIQWKTASGCGCGTD